MAIQGSLFADVDEATDRDSLDVLARVIEGIAERMATAADSEFSDVLMEYAGEIGARRTFGHSEQLTKGRQHPGEGAFFARIAILHLDDPLTQITP
jgi:hypothetical protein